MLFHPTPFLLEPPGYSLCPGGFLALPSQAESVKLSEPQRLPTFGLNQWQNKQPDSITQTLLVLLTDQTQVEKLQYRSSSYQED